MSIAQKINNDEICSDLCFMFAACSGCISDLLFQYVLYSTSATTVPELLPLPSVSFVRF